MITAIVQARMGSTRFPGKVLKPLLGKPMIQLLCERLKRSKEIDEILIATSVSKQDDPLCKYLDNLGYPYFRGSEEDVLERYYLAAMSLSYQPEHIVRITADCPLIDNFIVDEVIELHRIKQSDYTSNISPPSYPDGMDTEVFTFEALQKANLEARLPSEREHVTPYLRNSEKFSKACLRNKQDFSHIRLTVDTPEDFSVISAVFNHFYPYNPYFHLQEILQFLKENPDIQEINAQYERNEGLKKSVQADRQIPGFESQDSK